MNRALAAARCWRGGGGLPYGGGMDEAVRAAVSPTGTLAVRVTPKASAERIVVEGGAVRVYVTAPPDKGKANKAVIALVAKALGIPKSAVELVRGETSRDKLLKIDAPL
ncbi:DUF167 domain-containing protein [Sphingosinicella humi]|nr:DUF167 domain-containing protein [Sphingosinicella humi]